MIVPSVRSGIARGSDAAALLPFIRRRDADAADYIARVKATGAKFGTTLPMERLTEAAIDGYIKMNKEAVNPLGKSNWLAMKAANLLSGITLLEGVLVPMRIDMPTPTNVGFVQGDLSRTGLKGDSGKCLLSGRNNNADPLNNQSMGVYITEAHPAGTFAAIGCGGTDPGVSGIAASTIFTFRSQNGGAINGTSIPSSTLGFVAISRHEANRFLFRGVGATAEGVRDSQALYNGELLVFARGTVASPQIHSRARQSFYVIGEALNLAAADLAIATYMAAIS